MVNLSLKIGKIFDHIVCKYLMMMIPASVMEKIYFYRENSDYYREYLKYLDPMTYINGTIAFIHSIYCMIMSKIRSTFDYYYNTMIAEKNNLFALVDKTLRRYPALYDSIFYLLSMNMNRETAINMYHGIVTEKIDQFIKSINSELVQDERMDDYVNENQPSIIDDINDMISKEREMLYSLSNYELYQLSETFLVKEVQTEIDNICTDFNKLLSHEVVPRRIVRDNNSIRILKVSEEIKGSIWNVIKPWEQKYCVAQEYLDGIDIKDIHKEFPYYPKEETVNYITGDDMKVIVFPRTGLPKIVKVITAAKIRKTCCQK